VEKTDLKRQLNEVWMDGVAVGYRTEYVEEGVDEEVSVSVAGVALQHVDVVTRHVHVLDVAITDHSLRPTSPLCMPCRSPSTNHHAANDVSRGETICPPPMAVRRGHIDGAVTWRVVLKRRR